MQTKLILNQRISVASLSREKCEFIIDGSKKAVFHALDEDLLNLIASMQINGMPGHDVVKILSQENRQRGLKLLEELERCGFIDYHVLLSSGETVIINPTKKSFVSFQESLKVDQDYHFSKYNYFRVDSHELILENPLSTFKIKFPQFSKGLIEFFQGLSFENYDELAQILVAGNFLTLNEFEKNSPLQLWEFQDLIFHKATRLGSLEDGKLGGTYRFKNTEVGTCRGFNKFDQCAYFPLIKPQSPPQKNFFDVLYERKSSRSFGKNSLSPQQLSDFLYHTAHVKKICAENDQDIVQKVFPSAGSLHEIEFYVLLNRVDSLPRSIYYYHPAKHGLFCLDIDDADIDQMNNNAKLALNLAEEYPQVLIFLCSKMRKVAWKYEKIAYRNTLITAGAAFQTMYLVGAALELSTCAIGTGDPDLFARATSIDALEEPCIAEFALGSNKF